LVESSLHATALLLDDHGVLITGPSGAGKTTLALELIRQFGIVGRFARLVGDDQLFVRASAGRLIASCPGTIAGLVEVHGLGPRRVPVLDSAVVDLVIRLVAQVELPRYQEPGTETIAGVAIAAVDVPARNATASALAVAALLEAPPFP
jgi:serine kinase of HPr protein (carbohydrate metabolism regulator)